MNLIEIITAIASLVGVCGGLYCFFFIRQEREKRELENDSQIIEQYKSLADSQEKEHQRLLTVINRRNAKVDALEVERDKYLNLWLAERCIVKSCSYRKPPHLLEVPNSEADTL